MITIKRLSTGWYHICGIGPANWAQVPNWPCSDEALSAGMFAEAGATFRRAARAALDAAWAEARDRLLSEAEEVK